MSGSVFYMILQIRLSRTCVSANMPKTRRVGRSVLLYLFWSKTDPKCL